MTWARWTVAAWTLRSQVRTLPARRNGVGRQPGRAPCWPHSCSAGGARGGGSACKARTCSAIRFRPSAVPAQGAARCGGAQPGPGSPGPAGAARSPGLGHRGRQGQHAGRRGRRTTQGAGRAGGAAKAARRDDRRRPRWGPERGAKGPVAAGRHRAKPVPAGSEPFRPVGRAYPSPRHFPTPDRAAARRSWAGGYTSLSIARFRRQLKDPHPHGTWHQ